MHHRSPLASRRKSEEQQTEEVVTVTGDDSVSFRMTPAPQSGEQILTVEVVEPEEKKWKKQMIVSLLENCCHVFQPSQCVR